jgi:hypothetical protein
MKSKFLSATLVEIEEPRMVLFDCPRKIGGSKLGAQGKVFLEFKGRESDFPAPS